MEVKHTFDKNLNSMFLSEAKKTFTTRQKLSEAISRFLEMVSTDKYVDAKPIVKEMVQHTLESMITENKDQYQKQLSEEIIRGIIDYCLEYCNELEKQYNLI